MQLKRQNTPQLRILGIPQTTTKEQLAAAIMRTFNE